MSVYMGASDGGGGGGENPGMMDMNGVGGGAEDGNGGGFYDMLDEFLYREDGDGLMKVDALGVGDSKMEENEFVKLSAEDDGNELMESIHGRSSSSTNIISTSNKIFDILIENTVTFGQKASVGAVRGEVLTRSMLDTYLKLDAASLPHQMKLIDLPKNCRVENQVKIDITLDPPLSNQHILHLSTNNIAKQKLYLSKGIKEYPKNFQQEVAFLESYLLCAKTNEATYVCPMCIKREQRRASRRKSGLSDNLLWCNNDNRSALIFNNKQLFTIVDSKSINLIARMVCYSRHHKSLDGFKILFILKDINGNVLSKGFTSAIQIMDKKPSTISQLNKNAQQTGNVNSTVNSFSISSNLDQNFDFNENAFFGSETNTNTTTDTESYNTATNLSESNAYSSMNEFNENNNNYSNNYNQNLSVTPNSSTSVLPQNSNGISMLNSMIPPNISNSNNNNFVSFSNQIIPSPTSMSEDGMEFRYHQAQSQSRNGYSGSIASMRNESLGRKRKHLDTNDVKYHSSDSLNHSPLSWSNNHHGSSLKNSATSSSDSNLQNLANANVRMTPNNGNNTAKMNQPSVQRAIPSQGPISGGIEITLLGSNFKNNLIVKFGNNVALSTQCWSESTMVTYLPPAVSAGQVFVTVVEENDAGNLNPNTQQHGHSQSMTNMQSQTLNEKDVHPSKAALFTYVDDTDRQLIELALQIVGLKMNGKLEDARNIAKRIVGNDENKSPDNSCGSSNISPTNNNGSAKSSNSVIVEDQMSVRNDELLIVKVIKSLNSTSNLSMCDTLGRTLLHLASLKGYQNLVATLLKCGARVNDRDLFGYTPLHFACINGDEKIIKLLLRCKADLDIKSKNNMLAKQLFELNHYENETKFDEVAEIFSLEVDNYSKFRKTSTSSDLDVNSITSEDFEAINKMTVGSRSQNFTGNFGHHSVSEDSGYERSDFEEDGDDSLLASDVNSISSLTQMAGPETQLVSHQHQKTASINGQHDQHKEIDAESHDNSENHTSDGGDIESVSNKENGSLWNRMMNRINDDLPKYEELFPAFSQMTKQQTKETQEALLHTEIQINDTDRDSSPTEDMPTSSEDEEEALQLKINRFFQQKQSFQNDTMLWFFWLPLSIILISLYLFISFGPNDDKLHLFSTLAVDYFRKGLVKLLLGNDRMKAAFKEQLSNFQGPRLMDAPAVVINQVR